MKRRSVVALAGCAVATLSFAQAPRLRHIGILALGETAALAGPEPRSPDIAAFVQGMRDLGYAWGRDFVTEPRGAEGQTDRYAALAEQLVVADVDIIVAAGPALQALQAMTRSVPVVMAASGDPVGQRLVESLGHPGGNFTGLSLESVELTGKRLSLLKQIAPRPAPIGVLWDASSRPYWLAAERTAKQQGWTVLSLELRDASDIAAALKRASASRVGSLLASAPGLLYPRRREVAERAIDARLPAMFELRPYVEAGGLVSYGADIVDLWRRAAGFVDRILKGAQPGDLPVEQPTRFDLAVNLTTATALGIAIPQAVLLEASTVIR